jgi:hypothetical protein
VHVGPLAHTAPPVHPWPPHCPYLGTVAPPPPPALPPPDDVVGAAPVVDTVMVAVVVVVTILVTVTALQVPEAEFGVVGFAAAVATLAGYTTGLLYGFTLRVLYSVPLFG